MGKLEDRVQESIVAECVALRKSTLKRIDQQLQDQAAQTLRGDPNSDSGSLDTTIVFCMIVLTIMKASDSKLKLSYLMYIVANSDSNSEI